MPAMAETIPNRLVVLTFDDGNRSDHEFVAPLLERYGFGATFFITEGLGFRDDKEYFLTWEEVLDLHDRGFEIGNHTRSHPDVASLDRDELIAELDHIDRCCRDFGIPRPRTFCYPGYHTSRAGGRGAGRARLRVGALRLRADAPRPPHRSSPAGADQRGVRPRHGPCRAHLGSAAGRFRLRRGVHLPRRARSPPPLGVDRPGDVSRLRLLARRRGYSAIALRDLGRYLPAPATPADPYAAPAPPARHPFRTTAPQVIRNSSRRGYGASRR